MIFFKPESFKAKLVLGFLCALLIIIASSFFWNLSYTHFINNFRIEKESLQSKNSECLKSKLIESFINSCRLALVYYENTRITNLLSRLKTDPDKTDASYKVTNLTKDIKPNSDKILIEKSEFLKFKNSSMETQRKNEETEINVASNLDKKFIELKKHIDLHKDLKLKIDSQKSTKDQDNTSAFIAYIQAKQKDQKIFEKDFLPPDGFDNQKHDIRYDKIEEIIEAHTRAKDPIYNLYFVETYFVVKKETIRDTIKNTQVTEIPLKDSEREQFIKDLKISNNSQLSQENINRIKNHKRQILLEKFDLFPKSIKTGASK